MTYLINFLRSTGLRYRTVLCFILCFCVLTSFSKPRHPKTVKAKAKQWVGTWGTAPQLVEPKNMPPAPGLTNNTLRQVVCVSIGGNKMRLTLSNEYSKNAVTIKTVQVAVSKGDSIVDASSNKGLKFNGKDEIAIEPGAIIVSDPVSFKLKPRMLVAITIAFGETSPTITGHPGSRTTSYILPGTQTAPDADYSKAVPTDHWFMIKGIDVEASRPAAAVVVFGDSITDGRGSGTNKQNRWPDVLALRLLNNDSTKNIGVLNMGIGGNCVLRGGLGPTGLNRFNGDVLKRAGVKWLIILEGVNDLGGTRDSTAAANVADGLIAAYDKMINDAHAQGIKVYGATITPFNKSSYGRPYREVARNKINNWILTSGHFDAVIDLAKVMQDPTDASTLLTAAQTGDYLHPNELGYQMMGGAVDLALFK